jgi:hypothetical protein
MKSERASIQQSALPPSRPISEPALEEEKDFSPVYSSKPPFIPRRPLGASYASHKPSFKAHSKRTPYTHLPESTPGEECLKDSSPIFASPFITTIAKIEGQSLQAGKTGQRKNEYESDDLNMIIARAVPSRTKPLVSFHDPDEDAGNARDEYSPAIAQESFKLTDRMHPNKKTGQRGKTMEYCRSRRRKSSWILLLVILSIFGAVQALTDCQLVNNWLPDMFNGTGTACCDQTFTKCAFTSTKCGITCVDGLITEM